MKKRTTLNLPCICGHYEDDHFIGTITKKSHCRACSDSGGKAYYQWTHKFKLDNLKYLEGRYEQLERI